MAQRISVSQETMRSIRLVLPSRNTAIQRSIIDILRRETNMIMGDATVVGM